MVRPITKKHNLDHWGFYQVGEIKTYSKIEAIEISGKIISMMMYSILLIGPKNPKAI